MFNTCIQINLQRGFGGGEVFTAALTRALRRIGIGTLLFVDPHAEAWSSLPMPDTRVESLADLADLPGLLHGKPRSWLLFHTFAPAEVSRGQKTPHRIRAAIITPLPTRRSIPGTESPRTSW